MADVLPGGDRGAAAHGAAAARDAIQMRGVRAVVGAGAGDAGDGERPGAVEEPGGVGHEEVAAPEGLAAGCRRAGRRDCRRARLGDGDLVDLVLVGRAHGAPTHAGEAWCCRRRRRSTSRSRRRRRS